MGYLTRDAILSRATFPTETVDVPEWGGEVLVRGMSAWERDRFEQLKDRFEKAEDVGSLTALVAGWCMIGEDGKALFTAQDIKELEQMNAAPFQRVFQAIVRLTVYGEARDEVAEARVNFPTDPTGSSSSG